MYCRKCGYLNDDNSKYCASCGENLMNDNQNNLSDKNNTNEISLIFGLLSIFFVTVPILGLVLAVIGLITGKDKKDNNKGFIFSIIGLILNIIWIIVIICTLLNLSSLLKETINNENNNDYFYPNTNENDFSIDGSIFTLNDEYIISFSNNAYMMYKDANIYEIGIYNEYQGQASIDYINNNIEKYGIQASLVWDNIDVDKSKIDNYYLIILSPKSLTGDDSQNKYEIYFGLYDGNSEIDTKDLFEFKEYKFELSNDNEDAKSVV